MVEAKRIALLIDCDNVSHTAIDGVLAELAKHGMVNIRHAHGDWKSDHLSNWREKLHPCAIRPMQQMAYTKGKNATDIAMIIDAMDLLYSKSIHAFALMTSDSDFTPLVLRIHEAGLPVYGFGENKTPKAFIDACFEFIYIENLTMVDNEKSTVEGQKTTERKTRAGFPDDLKLVNILRNAVEKTADDDGWSHMSRVVNYIRNNSSISSVNYGYRSLSELIKASGLFEFDMRHKNTAMYIRSKPYDSAETPNSLSNKFL
ncbi:NYN domain-containing protein [Pseudomonas aeruginosa]|nr:NYN domain-containing protein [Pseudomonas aeruginosa]